jgi:hypothetical protein
MAKLQSGDMSLEIKFNTFEPDWVAYEVGFYWKDSLIVNPAVLKETGRSRSKRSYGFFFGNDYERDLLINTIKKVLDTNQPDYWQPIEPDITIAIYPYMDFPFGIKSHLEFVNEEDRKVYEEIHAKGECFTIITLIDTYNFKDSGAYSGNGISLHLIAKRERLEKFVADLESEYQNLKIEHTDPIRADVEYGAETIDALSLDPAIAELILFLQKNGPKTDLEILAGIPSFQLNTLGKVKDMELIDHCNHTIWLTSAGYGLATVLNRLMKNL